MSLGYEIHHSGKCYTVFSASNYCGQVPNFGAVMLFSWKRRSGRGGKLRASFSEFWAPGRDKRFLAELLKTLQGDPIDLEIRAELEREAHAEFDTSSLVRHDPYFVFLVKN